MSESSEFRPVCDNNRTETSLYTAQITPRNMNNDFRRKRRRVLWIWMKLTVTVMEVILIRSSFNFVKIIR